MNNINKITEGNAFALCIRQAVWHSIGGQIYSLQADELMDIELRVGQGSKATAERFEVSADGDTIKADMPSTLKRGVYKTWLTAVFNGRMVSSNCEAAFEVVPFDVHYPAFAPAKIEGAQAVYLQGISMNESELEAEKMRYKALIKQKEDEIALLAKEREKLTNVALQLDGVDESLDGISETLYGVAKEDTQQEIKKALDLVKAEISVEDKLNIRAAIELKGGQSVYKNPEDPALLELAKNVGTIPQKFMTLEPDGVRYDDPVEWHVFNQDVAYAVDAARALQNRIYMEGGIQSILNHDVKYKGFILVDVNLYCLKYESNGRYYYMQFDHAYADAYMISYNGNASSLVEWETGNIDKRLVKIELDKMVGLDKFYLILLYQEDKFSCVFPQIDYTKASNLGNVVIGGHPLSVRMENNNNAIRNCVIQLNITEETNFYIRQNTNFVYLRNKKGSVNSAGQFIYLEQMEEITNGSENLVINDYNHGVFIPNLKKINQLYYNTEFSQMNFNFHHEEQGGFQLIAKNAINVNFINLKRIYIGSDILYNTECSAYLEKAISVNYPVLENIEVYRGNIVYLIANSNLVQEFELPELKRVYMAGRFWPANGCSSLKRFSAPKLEVCEAINSVKDSFKINNCPALEEVYVPKLRDFNAYDSTIVSNDCIKIRKITVGDIWRTYGTGLGLSGDRSGSLVRFKDLIQIRYAEIVCHNQYLHSWQPTNAINDTISTLVEDGEDFANNREKFLWNFRNYIIAMLHDYSGTDETRTLTLHSMVANVLTDEDKLAITNKGWILSIV